MRINIEPPVYADDGPDSFRVLPDYWQCKTHGWHPDDEQARLQCPDATRTTRQEPRTLCLPHHAGWPHKVWTKNVGETEDCPGPTELVAAEAPCSYCGSLSGDRFMELAASGVELHGSDKSYKVYLSYGERGQEKFYWQHLSHEQRARFVELYNAKALNIEPQFGLYVLPFFMR